MKEKILEFLASKWFTLFLLVLMILALPTTYHNFKVVYTKHAMSQFWYLVAVFFVNIFACFIAFWKFLNQLSVKKEEGSPVGKQW